MTLIGTIHAHFRDTDGLHKAGITLDFHAEREKGRCTIAINKEIPVTRLGYLGRNLTAQDLRDMASCFMAMAERVDGPGKIEHEGD
jgi:hypothetical protein